MAARRRSITGGSLGSLGDRLTVGGCGGRLLLLAAGSSGTLLKVPATNTGTNILSKCSVEKNDEQHRVSDPVFLPGSGFKISLDQNADPDPVFNLFWFKYPDP